MPRVYWSVEPVPSPKSSSGQRFGPSLLSKSTLKEPPVNSTEVIFAVSSHVPSPGGESTIIAFEKSKFWARNEKTGDKPLVMPLASVARTRQNFDFSKA